MIHSVTGSRAQQSGRVWGRRSVLRTCGASILGAAGAAGTAGTAALGALPVAAQSTSSQPTSLRKLDLRSNDLVYDPFRRRIYASAPGNAGPWGNSIVVIDPESGATQHTIAVGSEPGQLALSDDGRFLYVGLNGAAAVRRVDLTAGPADGFGVAELQFPLLGSGITAADIAVQPGHPQTIAVSLRRPNVSPSHGGVAVFDDGAPRGAKTGEHTGANRIEFGGTPTDLYGYGNESTSFGFYRMTVDENGVTVQDTTGDLISGFYHDLIFDGGLIYASSGVVVDPATRAIVGTYPGVLPPQHRAFHGVPYPNDVAMVRPDYSTGRTFFLVGNVSDRQPPLYWPGPSSPQLQPVTMRIRAFDLRNFTQLGEVEVPGILGRATSLIRWGSDGLAFRTGGGQTVLLRSPVVSGTPTAHL